jgi:hypothetical protein
MNLQVSFLNEPGSPPAFSFVYLVAMLRRGLRPDDFFFFGAIITARLNAWMILGVG